MSKELLAALAGLTETGADNTYGLMARGIGQMSPMLVSPYNSTGSNIGATVGASLLAGILGGLAKRQANSENSALRAAMPAYVEAFNTGNTAALDEMGREHPQFEKLHSVLTASKYEMEQEAAAEERKLRAARESDIAKETDPRMVKLYEDKQIIKGKYDPSATRVSVKTGGGLGAETASKISEMDAWIDEARLLSKTLKADKGNWAEFQAAKKFHGLDKDGLATLLMNNADHLIRLRTGASLNQQEQGTFNRMIKGDLTAGPQQVGMVLEKLAAAEARHRNSRLDTYHKLNTEGIAGIRNKYDDLIEENQLGTNIVTGPDGNQYEIVD